MGRLVIVVAGLCLGLIVINPAISLPRELTDNFAFVAMFPAIYVFGMALLRD